MQEKISIIVPVYNCCNTIERCVKSIQTQSYDLLEIILVDDGASDGSGNICDKLAEGDKRIKVVHKVNQGVSHTRNTGMEMATGKYVMFVDSDDYLASDYVKIMLETLRKEHVELVISGYTYVGVINKVHLCGPIKIRNRQELMENFGGLYQNYYLHVVWNKLFIREKITECFQKGLSLGEDCLFVLNYLKNISQIAVIDCAGYYYFVGNKNSLTNKYRKDGFQIAELIFSQAINFLEIKEIKEDESVIQAVMEVFLTDVSKCLKEIGKNKSLDNFEKIEIIKEMAKSTMVREASLKCNKLGRGQKLIFGLLRREQIGLVNILIRYW